MADKYQYKDFEGGGGGGVPKVYNRKIPRKLVELFELDELDKLDQFSVVTGQDITLIKCLNSYKFIGLLNQGVL